MDNSEPVRRGPVRPPKAASEADESRSRADARLRELRAQADASPDRDQFWAPTPPDGWDYQWKRHTVLNQEDPSYQVELIRQGWEPVPLSRHPEMMPPGWKANTIEVGGMLLMERPEVLTREARLRDDAAAREAVLTKEAQLGRANKGDIAARRQVLVHRKTYEPLAVPADE